MFKNSIYCKHISNKNNPLPLPQRELAPKLLYLFNNFKDSFKNVASGKCLGRPENTEKYIKTAEMVDCDIYNRVYWLTDNISNYGITLWWYVFLYYCHLLCNILKKAFS